MTTKDIKQPASGNSIVSKETAGPDENTGVMIYGHLKIVDVDTGEILVNKRA